MPKTDPKSDIKYGLVPFNIKFGDAEDARTFKRVYGGKIQGRTVTGYTKFSSITEMVDDFRSMYGVEYIVKLEGKCTI